MKYQIPRGSRGISFVEILVSISVLMTSVLASIAIFYSQRTSQNQVSTKLIMNVIRQRVYEAVSSDSSWLGIQNDPLNSSLQCLNDPTNYANCPNQDVLLNLIKPEIGMNYRPTIDKRYGIDTQGNFCNSYPSGSCPFRMTLTWRPLCLSTCGANPLFQISAKFEPQDILSLASFDFKIIRTIASAPPATYTNLSFESALYRMFEDEVSFKGYKVIASPPSTQAIDFSICLTNVSSSGNFFWPAVSGVDVDALKCYPYTMPANQSELFIPSHALDSPTVPKNSPSWEVGYVFEVTLASNNPLVTTGGVQRARVFVYDKDNRIVLDSVRLTPGGGLIIKGKFNRKLVAGYLRDSSEVSFCSSIQVHPGAFTHSCPSVQMVQTPHLGDKVHLTIWPDGIIPNSNEVIITP